MAKFQAPKEFSFEPVEWVAWRERYERYCRACKLDTEDDAVRIETLIFSMGDKADTIVKTFSYATGEDKTKYDTINAKFEEYFSPRRNEIYERSLFHSRKQGASESIEQYYNDFYELLLKCNYPESVTNDMLRDRFVLGLNDRDMQRKLFMEQSLTVKTVVDMARQNELIKSQMRSQPASVIAHEVNKMRGRQVQRGSGNSIGFGHGNHGNASGTRPQVGAGYRGRGNAARSGISGRDKSCDNCGYPRHRTGKSVLLGVKHVVIVMNRIISGVNANRGMYRRRNCISVRSMTMSHIFLGP